MSAMGKTRAVNNKNRITRIKLESQRKIVASKRGTKDRNCVCAIAVAAIQNKLSQSGTRKAHKYGGR